MTSDQAKEPLFYALEKLPLAMFVTDLDGNFVYTNPGFKELFGWGANDENQQMILFGADDAEYFHLLQALQQNGVISDYKLRTRSRDNNPLWLSISAQRFEYRQETLIFWLINNITDYRRNEEFLAQQLERLRILYEIQQAVVSSLDLQKVLKMLVRQVTGRLGLDAAAVLLFDLQRQRLSFAARQGFRTDALKFTNLALGAGLAGQAARGRKTVHIPDLTTLRDNPSLSRSIAKEGFVAYIGVPLIAKEQLVGVMEIFHRSALADAKAWITFLETLAGQAALAIYNAHLMQITQNQLNETQALYHINKKLIASLDAVELMQEVAELLQQNFGYSHIHIFVQDPQSGDFILRAASGLAGKEMIAQGYRLAAGEGVVGYIAEIGEPFFTNDVESLIAFKRPPLVPETKSELAVPIRAGEDFLGLIDVHQAPPRQLSNHDLQLVSAVADQLAIALQKASLYTDLQAALEKEKSMRQQLVQSERLALVGRLLASVSHELNNPLQAIQNALFLIKKEANLSEQVRQDLQIILSETERMAALIQRLRISYRPPGLEEFQPVQLNGVVEDVHALIATHLRQNEITFEFHPAPNLPPVRGIPNQLRQVILNLLINAVQAVTSNGRLIVSTEALESGEVMLSVSDNGGGIDPALLPHIFDPFITNKEDGSGLGLAIAREIVNHHEGRIQAENNPGGGATFRVWLPVFREEER
ncbi:MAG: GAF domain-containing protein [Anaerolineales bacterium]